MTQSFGQRFLAPVTRRPGRRPHNSPRPFPTFRQTACLQQPPRRRKPRDPNVPPVLPQQVERAQLMRRIPAIDQLNPRRDGPVPIADQMLRMLRPLLPGPVNHFGPGPESPQGRSGSSIADYPQFGSPATGSRPQPVQFQRSVRRQFRHGQTLFPQPPANRTLDAAHPVTGAGIAQSLRSQTEGGITVFWKTAGGALPRPAASCRPSYGDTGRSGTRGSVGGLRRSRWQWRGRSDDGGAWPGGNGRRGAGSHPGLVGGTLAVGRGVGVPVGFPGGPAVISLGRVERAL